nr:transposase [Loktanella sp. SALINAS62]
MRDEWFKHRLPAVTAQPDRVVFIDETSVKTNLTRQRGWSQRGERLVIDAPFGSWGTQTFIAGLGANALIAPWVIKGAMDGEAFAAYVTQVLLTELEPGTVVILDNFATHKNAAAAKAMREAKCSALSRKYATSSPRTSAGITSRLPDMSQVKSRML